jgi:tRNA (cmo5U34)-methyltransferase
MNDNKTAHMAKEYDGKVRITIPNYEFFHSETINLVKTVRPEPEKWLDTGCGTGTFVLFAMKVFNNTSFVLADPSVEMLAIAKEKLSQPGSIRAEVMQPVSSEEIDLPDKNFDVITAIQAHHYLDVKGRKGATRNCFRMLKSGGIYITFENIRPLSEKGIKIGLERWKQLQISQGKTDAEAENHTRRFGVEYFPITITEHMELLREVGFSTVELLWFSYMQAGFYAVKE